MTGNQLFGLFFRNKSIVLFRQAGKRIDAIVSIGGGARSHTWLQMQADIFQAEVIQLENEQEPALGAAMLANLMTNQLFIGN